MSILNWEFNLEIVKKEVIVIQQCFQRPYLTLNLNISIGGPISKATTVPFPPEAPAKFRLVSPYEVTLICNLILNINLPEFAPMSIILQSKENANSVKLFIWRL